MSSKSTNFASEIRKETDFGLLRGRPAAHVPIAVYK